MVDSRTAPEEPVTSTENSPVAPPIQHLSQWHRTTHRIASLTAALAAPFSVLFALPGLTEHWMVLYDSAGVVVQHRPDPTLLVVSGSFALALAVLANLALTLRFVGTHTRFATVSAMLFLAIQITINLIALLIFGLEETDDSQVPEFTLSAAYWLTAPFVPIFNIANIPLYTPRYLLDVNFLDAIYFTVQTSTTTGFGDITVATTGARIFVIFYAMLGILSFALVVAFTRSTVLEGLQAFYQARERAILNRLHRRTSFQSRIPLHTHRSIREDVIEPPDDTDGQRYEAIIKALQVERKRVFRAQAIVSLLIVLAVWLWGAAVYSWLEHWNYFIAIYFTFVSASTIGYGEITPKTPGGRVFFCSWSLVSATSLTIFLSILADAQFGRHTETHQHNWIHRFAQKIRPSASRAQKIRKEEEQARSASYQTADAGELPAPRFPPPQQTPSSPISLEKPPRDLLQLIRDVRRQFDLLVVGGDSGAAEGMERVVAETLKTQHVGVRTRDQVETSEELTRFVFLRQLQSKLETLEQQAVDVLGERERRDEGEEQAEAEETGEQQRERQWDLSDSS